MKSEALVQEQALLPLAETLLDAPQEPRLDRFHAACKLVLKKDFSTHRTQLTAWYSDNVAKLPAGRQESFLQELELSAKAKIPDRLRGGKGKNKDISKFIDFLGKLIHK